MAKTGKTTYTDEEIINRLTYGEKKIDDYYLAETYSGDYTIAACFNGQHFDFFWEDEEFFRAALNFLKNRGARIEPYED
ncbi:hypothetical protein CBJ65_21775 [Salmonella enterica subsp. enterica serovar Agama]|nr:hypothetical protein [Salmonella enterica]EEA9968511.1 hypothetical protein [Salmonella enterica subsp. enterica serovar Agama]